MALPSLNSKSLEIKKEIDRNNERLIEIENQFTACPTDEKFHVNEWYETGWVGTINLDLIISYAIEMGASDIHLLASQQVSFTIDGDIVKMPRFGIPDEDVMTDIVNGMLTHEDQNIYIKDMEYDTSYKVRFGPYKNRRLRVNLGKSFGADQITFRIINDVIPSTVELGIDDNFLNWFENSSGVILICGATGSGKSTSLASIINDLNYRKKLKILTIEKPIEYLYPKDGQSLIVQRAIPEDCHSFSNGLTSAMRSAPDVILIGEVRNKEEVDELLRAAETGHLSLSTIHTANNVTTLNRIRSLYDGEEQRRILSTLGDTLRGVMNQTLVKNINGKGRFAVREFLRIDYRIRKLIAEDRISEVRAYQEQNELTMEHQLAKAVLQKRCTLKEARSKAPDQIYFDEVLEELKDKMY